jgi:hypothetical protein
LPYIGPLAREAFFLLSPYRGDRFLWTLAWSSHDTLVLVLIGHARIATGLLDRALGSVGMGPGAVAAMMSDSQDHKKPVATDGVHDLLSRAILPSCHPAILPSCHPAPAILIDGKVGARKSYEQ